MFVILNLAVGGCYGGCPKGLFFKEDCKVDKNTVFPGHFQIDWIRFYQKRNTVLRNISWSDVLCVGKTTRVYLPSHPGSRYQISTSAAGLDVQLLDHTRDILNYGRGRILEVTPTVADSFDLYVSLFFDSINYHETRILSFRVDDGLPATPDEINYVQDFDECAYRFWTPAASGTQKYHWSHTYETVSSPLLSFPIFHGYVRVSTSNACGTSDSYSESFSLPRILHPQCTGGAPELRPHTLEPRSYPCHVISTIGQYLLTLEGESQFQKFLQSAMTGMYFMLYPSADMPVERIFIP